MQTLADLVSDLRTLGVEPGDKVLTHTSLKAIGPVDGGAQTVLRAVLEAVGEAGTALFPTHTWHNATPRKPPRFDVRSSPALVIGVLPEVARTWPGGVRSVHPTHSVVAFGSSAVELCSQHHLACSPCGPSSPYALLADLAGKILLLGVDHTSNTSIHSCEEIAEVPDCLEDMLAEGTLVFADGSEQPYATKFHRWSNRDFNRAEALLNEAGKQRIGSVGQADCRLLDASAMRKVLVPLLQREPEFFLVRK